MQSGEMEILATAVRQDIDALPRVGNRFKNLRFEGDWFELRTTWESFSWWRKKGSLGNWLSGLVG